MDNKTTTSPEDAREEQQKIQEFMESKLPFLRVQVEYEESIARVNEAKFRVEMARSGLIKLKLQQQEQAERAKNESQNSAGNETS